MQRQRELRLSFAINKIDKPSANIERVKQELSEYELIPEDWGGSTVFCRYLHILKKVSKHQVILLTAESSQVKRQIRSVMREALSLRLVWIRDAVQLPPFWYRRVP